MSVSSYNVAMARNDLAAMRARAKAAEVRVESDVVCRKAWMVGK